MKHKRSFSLQIQTIFEGNVINDLKKNFKKRECLNVTNMYLVYIFHIIQTSGVFLSSYGTAKKNITFVWLGISCNMVATLINVFERTNYGMLKKLAQELQLIKSGNYLDETELIDVV
jgi:signal transduction histidine kinase